MIDLPTQKEMASPHHRRALWALVGAGVLLGAVMIGYYLNPQLGDFREAKNDVLIAQRALMNQQVAPASLTPEEIRARQMLLNKSTKPSGLTPDQIKARQALLAQ